MTREWTREVVSTVALSGEMSFPNDTRFGVAYVWDLNASNKNLYVELQSHSHGTAGFRLDMPLDEFNSRVGNTLIPLYKKG